MKAAKLMRSGGMVAGVAAGLAARLGGNANYYRLAFVALSFFHGLGILVYVGLALVVKSDKNNLSPVDLIGKTIRQMGTMKTTNHQQSYERDTKHSTARKELHDVSEKDIKD